MKSLKPLPLKKSSKQEREKKILLGLVAHFIKNGKPVGSHTLQEAGFEELSSATIRNYFQTLEEEGFLEQQHTSAGRIPTSRAFKFYAEHCLDEINSATKKASDARRIPQFDGQNMDAMKEVVIYLQRMCETVAEFASTASFLSAPRFDQDFVVDMKLIAFDQGRYISALLTNFGQIHTEILHSPVKLTQHSIKRMESYFHSRLTQGALSPEELDKDELELAHRFYQEAMARYLVSYSNFSEVDLFRAGFSKLLKYPEFQDAQSLASSLSLFENQTACRHLIKECMKAQKMKVWIGDDLMPHLRGPLNCAVIAAPYRIGQKIVGAIGVIGPMRIFYDELFTLLTDVADSVSDCLTRSLMKYKIAFREPDVQALNFSGKEPLLLKHENK